jgi:hypothetical protein
MEAWKIGLLVVLIAVLVFTLYAASSMTIISASDASGNKFYEYKTSRGFPGSGKPHKHYGDGYYL